MDDNQPQENPGGINLQDMATVVQIIDIASRRGAFEGRELQGVGMLRNKIEAFLQAQTRQPEGNMPMEAMADVPQDAELADKVVS
jgi:hypothetical protein